MLMKWEPGGMKSELARARGLGSARDGVKHWLHQRVSGVALAIVLPFLAYSLIGMVHQVQKCTDALPDSCSMLAYQAASIWVKTGLTPILMLLFLLASFYHAKLGLQIVIEDYIHKEGQKLIVLVLTKLALGALLIACAFATLKITL